MTCFSTERGDASSKALPVQAPHCRHAEGKLGLSLGEDLISLQGANNSPAGVAAWKPASLPLTWGMKWCRKGELGRESLWVELRLLVRR